jgi:hypothetical protein
MITRSLPHSKLLRLGLIAALISLAATGACQANATTARSPTQPANKPQAKPSRTPQKTVEDPTQEQTTITGIVHDVSLSARIFNLKSPSGGFDVIALSEGCLLTDSTGRRIDLTEISAGMEIRATGIPGSPGVLIAEQVMAFET